MIPPFIYRCPNCGHINLRRRFAVVGTEATPAAEDRTEAAPASEGGRRAVECPRCGHQFEVIDNPWLK